jgi:deoxyribodipyrimidine photo-lyase
VDPHDPDPDVRRRTGYPPPIVDHAEERREALRRWEQIRR